jgi:hypothetical protein
LGSTTRHGTLTAVSNPVHPDNSEQTIIQPSLPPNILLEQEVRLPNIVIGNPLAPAIKPIDLSAKAPKHTPSQAVKDIAAPMVPLPVPEMKLAQLPAAERPVLATPPPPPAPAEPAPAANAKSAEPAAAAEAAQMPGPARDDKSLLSLSTDPAPEATDITVPPGNRYGEFSISPAGTHFGSPGGSGTVSIGGATTGISAGGDGSTGVGHGNSGGGGGGSVAAPAVSLKGPVAVAESGYNKTIFEVPAAAPHVRKNAMVISAGPMGGGGLGVYKALPCPRVYTVFLPMPAANWILQYCAPGQSGSQSVSAVGSTTVVKMEESLVPPSPMEKFDFHRLPVSAEKARKNIILKGSIAEDGSVANLQVYQGMLREMDELAKSAFNRWKFAPAMRAGKPVAVEILVGIPSFMVD